MLFLSVFSMIFTIPLYQGTVVVRPFDVVAVIFALTFGIYVFTDNKIYYLDKNLMILLCLFAAYNLSSILWGGDITVSIKHCVQLLEIMLFIIIFYTYFGDIGVYYSIKYIFVSVLSITILYFFIMIKAGHFIGNKNFEVRAVTGLGAVLALLFYFDKESSFVRKVFFMISFLFCLFIAVISLERKAWVATCLSLFFSYGYHVVYVKGKTALSFVSSVLKLTLAFIILSLPVGTHFYKNNTMFHKEVNSLINVSSVFESGGEIKTTASNKQRFELFLTGYQIFLSHPLLGVGAGEFIPHYKRLTSAQVIHYPHNEYLRVLAELGAIGLFIFLLFHFYFCKIIKKYRKTNLQYTHFLLAIWLYGVVLNLFRVTNLLNLILLFSPLFLMLIYVKQNKNQIKKMR